MKKFFKLKKGLDLPIQGEPVNTVEQGPKISKVAIVGDDYAGMKPSFLVKEGDHVKLGQPLFKHRKIPKVLFTSPGSGKVVEINRGEKRAFQSVVIELDDKGEEKFASYDDKKIESLTEDKVKEQLLQSGEWVALRRRPFGTIADPDESPHSIFVTAMDTNPLAPQIASLVAGKEQWLVAGLKAISKLTAGKVHFVKDTQTTIAPEVSNLAEVYEFSGPHPAGNAGTHIHFIDPVGPNKFVWYLGIQDLIAIGHLFATGKILTERIVSLAGPSVKNPRYLRTRAGASLSDLTNGELNSSDEVRTVSGSVLSGRLGTGVFGYLGRYHNQVSALPEGRERFLFGWIAPALHRFSVKNVVFSRLFPGKKFKFTTAKYGGHRAIVPIGSYEKVMPLDILPTFLLRSLLANDLEGSEQLGVLELDEEDMALCTFVSPGKEDFGPIIRNMLTRIEKEG